MGPLCEASMQEQPPEILETGQEQNDFRGIPPSDLFDEQVLGSSDVLGFFV